MNTAITNYPGLQLKETGGTLSLFGEVDIIHPTAKKLIDTFSVEITFPKQFPFCFPRVIETSGKIERTQDRHVYTENNTLCFAVWADELLTCRHGITTQWFLDNVLVPRLAEEYLVNNGGNYAHEYAHGVEGDFQHYFKKFKTENPNEVIRLLKLILIGGFPKHYEKCSCGSGLKFKKCHRIIFEDLKALGNNFITFEIDKLEKFLEKIKQKKNQGL